ncbi:MAG: hypothetical protein A3K10_07100 [Bacteroidetes bacterium RIFCSPLOWO2_12_FULL_31_6]|nr:MAG: hypothetical protein A3K10_07100 [Bacteroidetes bacterium RIFCSPLOWO2_12_FULL_31_6]
MKIYYFKILLGLFLIISLNSANAQYQSLFGTTQTSWNLYSQDMPGDFMDSLVVCCDTVINSKNYKVVDDYKFCFGCNPNPNLFSKVLFLREDTTIGKAWQITPDDTINENLIMDLSLTITDSFEVASQFYDVDSVYVKNGKKHIRLVGPLYTSSYDEKYTMIEGVGTNIGIGVDFFYGGPGNSLYLLCSYKDNNVEYQNTHPMYSGYCFLLTGINENENNIKINVYPNPSINELTIDYFGKKLDNLKIEIYNTTGKLELIKELRSGKTTVNTYDLSTGIYFIALKDNQKTIATQKWVKTE